MSNPSDRTRRRLFKDGAAAIGKLLPGLVAEHPELVGAYLCPQCLRFFSEAALDGPDPRITIEHMPPQGSYSGPYTQLLVCKRCNNVAGSHLDAHMERQLAAASWAPGDARRVTLSIDGRRVRATLAVLEDGSMTLRSDERRSNPEELQAAIEALSSGAVDGFSGTWSAGYRDASAAVAYLRLGYLVSFAAWGYRYVLPSALDIIRDQIANPDDELVPRRWLIRHDRQSPALREIWILDSPARSIGVEIGDRLVLVPVPGKDAETFYNELAEMRDPLVIEGRLRRTWPQWTDHTPWSER